MRGSLLAVWAGVALGGCALKSDVRRVEGQLADFRADAARADSARAVTLARILDQLDANTSEVRDSLRAQRQALFALRGEFRTDLTQVLRSLVAMQELMGQSQVGLNELRRQLEERPPVGPSPGGPDSSGAVGAAGPGPEELFELGIQQLRQGSRNTARLALQTVLDSFPQHPRAPDALFFIGETWEDSNPDSAVAAYEQVVEAYPESGRAPTALFRLGLIAERQGDAQTARLHFQRLIVSYPDSDEAERAREKIGRSARR